MLGTSTLVGSSGDGAHEGGGGGGGGGGEVVVGPQTTAASIMSGIGDDEKGRSAVDLFEGDRSTGGNRWPRQETLALLKIRSDMDVVFRDTSLKGPLWEEVSRKMAELGYHRSAKKCKEKFENVYKYHKRTKDGRVGKSDGKTYRFFDQLEALEKHHLSITASSTSPPPSLPSLPQPQTQPSAQATPRAQSQVPAQAAVPVTMVIPVGTNPATVTVSSSPHHPPISVIQTSSMNAQACQMNPINQVNQLQSSSQPQVIQQQIPTFSSIQMEMENPSSPSATQSSSSSTSSDEELLGRRKRKRKWKDFFERLMKEVIDKQEELQKRFLEAVEKREHDRVAREKAWKIQEMARLNREHDILVQERSMAAAKDAALIAFLQKLSDQQQIPLPLPVQVQVQTQSQPPHQGQVGAAVPVVASTATAPQPVLQQPQPQPPPQSQQKIHIQESPVLLPSPTQSQPQPVPPSQPQPQALTQLPQQPPLQQAIVVANTNNGDKHLDLQKANNGDNLLSPSSSSRWPKAEVQALINLRTSLDQKYQENGPKGPLWEEISAAMKKLGYNRNAKRCKEKWENINKYFKKVKESNKKRADDSKTCPYFHQLDAIYKEKNKMDISTPVNTNTAVAMAASYGQQQQQQMKHDGSLNASMAPIMAQPEQQWPPMHGHSDQIMEDQGSENQDDSEDDGDEEDDEDQGSGYEIVANNNANAGSISTSTTASRTATAE